MLNNYPTLTSGVDLLNVGPEKNIVDGWPSSNWFNVGNLALNGPLVK